MIYELRTYTFHPGKIPAWLELVPRILSLRADADKCRGYWTAEFGQLNQGWHLWGYDSLDQRAQLRAEMPKNERLAKELLPAVRSLLQRQDTRFLNPVIDLKPPASGGIYEIRIYRAQPGMAGAWTQLIKSYLPAREKYSPIVGLWTGEAPQPNEVLHMWNYPDLNTRAKVRAEFQRDPEWQAFVAANTPKLLEMQSVLLMPTPFSALR
jgi:NIPSNAP